MRPPSTEADVHVLSKQLQPHSSFDAVLVQQRQFAVTYACSEPLRHASTAKFFTAMIYPLLQLPCSALSDVSTSK
jgi:hypothetical protein